MSFQEQMQQVREQQQSKYENKLMQQEESVSAINEVLREKEEEEKRHQRQLYMEAREQKKKEDAFVSTYVVNYLNSHKGGNMNIEEVKQEARRVFHNRQIILAQDEEYARQIEMDLIEMDLNNK